MQTGTIPVTKEIVLDSCTEQWLLLSKGLITSLSTIGIIDIDSGDYKKVKVHIVLTSVLCPDKIKTITKSIVVRSKNCSDEDSEAVQRIDQFFVNECDRSTWSLTGFIKGKKNIPILIFFYQKFNYLVYTVLQNQDDIEKFFPKGIPENFQMN